MSEEGVFSNLIGHGGAKAILRAALRDGTVDVLLCGPPASGKSVALLAIEEHIHGALYKDAAGFTERELRDAFSRDPEVLLLDEIDAMQNGAYEAMSMPMEQNRVTKDTNHDSYDKEVHTQVFAACNDESDLPAHTADRFRSVTFEEYSYQEFEDVCAVLLPSEVEWVDGGDDARTIAETIHDAIDSKSPRDARDAAKLAGDLLSVPSIAEALEDPKADVDSDPLLPSELAHRNNSMNDHHGDGDTESGLVPRPEWNRESCPHLNSDLAYQSGRFLCPDCAAEHGVTTDTRLSEAQ